MRAGVGLTALLTAGEKGDAIVDAPGDGATLFSVKGAGVDAGATTGLLAVLTGSGFAGVSTSTSAHGGAGAETDFGDGSAGVEADHGGACGWVGGHEASRGVSGLGASGSSSVFGSGRMGAETSASVISMSTEGSGVGSFAGVSSLCAVSGRGSVDVSMAKGSSSGGDGGSGEGLFEDTSFKAGDLASLFTDVDRTRSRCSLSSWACCKSLRLNDMGGFNWRGLTQV